MPIARISVSTYRLAHTPHAYLCDEAIEVGVRGSLNVQVAPAHVVQGLIVQAERHIRMLEQG
eukprot:31807-Eustigmatos_ZCMA.PRE.1